MRISELPNSHTYPLRSLAELRRNEYLKISEAHEYTDELAEAFRFDKTPEKDLWYSFALGETPRITDASIEDLRLAGMLPEPETPRIDTAPPPPFYCYNSESTSGPCAKQCPECDVDEREYAKGKKPSITLEDYASMEDYPQEESNTTSITMKYQSTLEHLKVGGGYATRQEWAGNRKIYFFSPVAHGVELAAPDGEKIPLAPFFVVREGDGPLYPYIPSAQDMEATDWQIFRRTYVQHL